MVKGSNDREMCKPLALFLSQFCEHIKASSKSGVRRLRCSLSTLPLLLKADSENATYLPLCGKNKRICIDLHTLNYYHVKCKNIYGIE